MSSARPRAWEWGLAAAVSLTLFQSLRAVFAGRLLRLACQDHANFSSFYHVAWNFQDAGVFRQTAHGGYADNWLWGGHYTLTFPVASALLWLHPTPAFLNALQLAAVCSGVFAGLLLGRGEARHPAGGLLGMAAVALSPPVLVLALADYQDLVLCLPAVLWATAFLRRGWRWPALLACLGVAACREECAMLLPLLGLAVPGGLRRRLVWAALASLCGLAVVGGEVIAGRHIAELTAPIVTMGPPVFAHLPALLLRGDWWAHCAPTYWLLLEPLGWLLVLAPLHALGVAGVLALHFGDTFHAFDWNSPLVHHFTPAVALATAGAVLGWGRLVRWLEPRGRRGQALVWVLLALAVMGGAWRVSAWRVFRGAAWHAPLTGRPSASIRSHPAWALAARIPPEAAVVTDLRLLPAAMSRPRVYEFHESLEGKTAGLRLACVHFALVPEQDPEFRDAVRAAPGARLVESLDGTELYALASLDVALPAACTWGAP